MTPAGLSGVVGLNKLDLQVFQNVRYVFYEQTSD